MDILSRLLQKSFKVWKEEFFPPFCLHCQKKILWEEIALPLFCPSCAERFIIQEKEIFCGYCFSPIRSKSGCFSCKGKMPFEIFSVFEKRDVIVSFHRHMKFGNFPVLAKLAAAYIVYQYDQLYEEFPEYIMTSRQTFFGYDLQRELSLQVAKLMKRPLWRGWKHPFERVEIKQVGFVLDQKDEEKISQLGKKALERGAEKIFGMCFCKPSN